MAEIPLETMVEAMAKSDKPSPDNGFTLGWDVVVSYSQKEINRVLETSWQKVLLVPLPVLSRLLTIFGHKHKNEMIASVKAVIPIPEDSDDDSSDDDDDDDNESDDGGGKPRRSRSYDLQLGAPHIRFSEETVRPAVDLVIPVQSGTFLRSDRPKPVSLPNNSYEFVVRDIPLGTVTGTYEEVKGQKSPNIEGDCVFKNKPQSGAGDENFEVSWVVLKLDVEHATLKSEVKRVYGDNCNPKQKKRIDKRFPRVKELCEAFFSGDVDDNFQSRFNVIRHALATVKNKSPPRQNGVTLDLTPTSFRFATCSSNSILKEPALSLFIHVADGKDSGEKNDLQAMWQGIWMNATPKIPPIPATHTASILIHPELLFNKAIKDSMVTNVSADAWKVTRKTGLEGGGMAFEAAWQKPFAQDTFYIKLPREDWEWVENIRGAPHLEVEGWSKDLTLIPATIRIYQEKFKTAPVVSVEWEFSIESQWQKTGRHNDRQNKNGARGEKMNNKTTFSINHKIPLAIKATDYDITFHLKNDELASHCCLKDEWKHWKSDSLFPWLDDLDQEMARLERKILGDNWDAKAEALKMRHDKMREVMPKFSFGTVGLGFFLTTNLLNPGAKVIDIDKEVGMRMPGNLLLVGHVVQGKDVVKGSKYAGKAIYLRLKTFSG
ncbi:hypothetical protein FSPOR_1635 [Fusarium sporotrichioides]|uniref:Uncharacterized protein n=1 Tax=Fusarium sporotrichioides TaxID=5514 RepID=A0A395SNB9_FUSSP|nr:hypothetical protein FSPOR_1635 [Fusarium sporotrichioides]